MKAFLMHRDEDVNLQLELPANEAALTQDLELNAIFATMAAGDPFLFEVTKRALFSSLRDPGAIVYRQRVLADCLENPSIVRELYSLAGEAIKADNSIWGGLSRDTPKSMLRSSVQKLELLVGFLRRLRQVTDEHAAEFDSEGFTRFCAMLAEELDDDYFDVVDAQLKELKFRGGMLLSSQLSAGNKGSRYMLRQPPEQSWFERVFDRSRYSFTIPDRDENGFRALGELEDRGLNLVANALTQSRDHVLSFFVMLRTEVGFYLACVNLHERLAERTVDLLPRSSGFWRGRTLRAGSLRRRPDVDRRSASGGQRRQRRRQTAGDDHGSQPGRKVDLPPQRGCGAADDPMRHVRSGRVVPRQRLRWDLHALQARRRREHGERQAR